MDPTIAKKILDAIAADDPKAALEVLKEIATSLIGGASDAADAPPEPTASTADPPQPDPNEPPATQSREGDERLAALERELADLKARNAELDGEARRELIAELVRIGAETPATAWQRDAKGAVTATPCARLAAEPLKELRERVAVLSKALPRRIVPPVSDRSEAIPLPPRVAAAVAKMDPEQRAKFERYQAGLAANRKVQ